jgi:FKBP12-rapamycin complex-associated protein
MVFSSPCRLSTQHQLYFAYVRHLWATDKREEAMHRLSRLSDVVDLVSCCEGGHEGALRVACWLELGEWRLEQASTRGSSISDSLQVDALGAFRRATSSDSCGYSAWHAWALLNFRIAEQMRNREERSSGRPSQQSKRLANHVCVAVKGFVNAISCGTKRWSASVQQDLLNLLTCLFQYGELSGVASAVNEGMRVITLEAWLGVLPQLLARIHMRTPSVRSVLHPLLVRLGENHPQALMYPLSVLVKSPVTERKAAAESLMNSLKEHSSSLVDEALLVSSELIRVAILWLEQWNATLDDASRVLYEKGNVAGFLDLLLPLHEEIERGGETQQEKEFLRNYGEELAAAHGHMKAYMDIMKRGGLPIPSKGGFDASGQYESSGCLSQAEGQLNKAWDIYYTVFRRINRQLPPLTKLQLRHCSPALSRAHNLELGIPGSYRVDGSYTKIERFVENMHVITSKQRPRKISLRGSDGKDYVYLLKGHEDLRQDERVMQLFGLVNALLARDRQTKKHDLNIQRYTIVPLSHDCGLVGWVPHSDTLHSLVRDYRQNKKIRLNMESHEMTQIAPDYDLLPVLQKVEVFTEALRRAIGRGNDLYEILWLHSTNSEEWLDRRTRYTRSLAVMSMVGYILGLGDRHPSNLMIDQQSGRVLHIDFGDCFEVAMHRDKYPEKIPFRLTRMLVKAMEVSGIEGSYRSTCERTMTVLRDNRDSLVTMLEAFVYDPLISWRLVGIGSSNRPSGELSLGGADMIVPEAPAQTNQGTTNEPVLPSAVSSNIVHESIAEGLDEDAEEPDGIRPLAGESVSERVHHAAQTHIAQNAAALSSSRAASVQQYYDMQSEMADLRQDTRLASIAGESAAAAEGSVARSRMARSLQQRQVMSWLEGEDGAAHEEALNEKALEVIRRVQDKLSGTDFCDPDDERELREPLDVSTQVSRLIVQATSTENLCQLFIGMCAFW